MEGEGVARLKGSKNKNSDEEVITSSLTPDERIKMLANLLIDRMIEDQKDGHRLLRSLMKGYHGKSA